VVYFAEDSDAVFTTDDLRVRVGTKEREDPIPLCYCFGFDGADVREEIARTGVSVIPQKISAMVKQGLCACETRNPSGACCLGEVTKTVNRFSIRKWLDGRENDGDNPLMHDQVAAVANQQNWSDSGTCRCQAA
jgi:hypothetical protein